MKLVYLDKSYSSMSKTIQDFQNIIEKAIERLKNAAGDDPFLSESDWRKFLNEELPEADLPFFNRLIELAFHREQINNPGGRVTKNDLELLPQYISENILPYFAIQEGAFPPGSKAGLENNLGFSPSIFAEEWKIFTETPSNLEADPLAALIESYLVGVTLGGYASGGQRDLLGLFIEADISGELTEDVFFETLDNSGIQSLIGIRENYQVERFTDGRQFIKRLHTSQNQEAQRFNARKLARLYLTHLRDIKLVILFRDEQSWIPLFVVGVTESNDLVGFQVSVIWS